jgi:hypothetical protein
VVGSAPAQQQRQASAEKEAAGMARSKAILKTSSSALGADDDTHSLEYAESNVEVAGILSDDCNTSKSLTVNKHSSTQLLESDSKSQKMSGPSNNELTNEKLAGLRK